MVKYEEEFAEDIAKLLIAAQNYTEAAHAFMNIPDKEYSQNLPELINIKAAFGQLCYVARIIGPKYLVFEDEPGFENAAARNRTREQQQEPHGNGS